MADQKKIPDANRITAILFLLVLSAFFIGTGFNVAESPLIKQRAG